VIHDAVMGSRSSIAGGETIAGPLKESGVFPPMVVGGMIVAMYLPIFDMINAVQ
jgi:type IV pilus assembly protein PilC